MVHKKSEQELYELSYYTTAHPDPFFIFQYAVTRLQHNMQMKQPNLLPLHLLLWSFI